MALQAIPSNFGQGGSKLSEQGTGGLKSILTEMKAAIEALQTETSAVQDLKFTTVTGAATATNIAVTGLSVGDSIKHIINLTDLADVSLAGLAITAGNFQITAVTTAKKLLVIWQDVV